MIELYDTNLMCYRCSANAWEIVGTRQLHGSTLDVLQCAFCGVLDSVASSSTKAPRPASHGSFKFRYGRFAGMTLAEADEQPNGRRYLEHLRDTNEKLRDTIAEYITTAAPSARSGCNAALAAKP